MQAIREFMKANPWAGWLFAAVMMGLTVWVYLRGGGNDPYSTERLTQMVTIRFADTGDEVKMTRAEMEQELRSRAGRLETGAGIVNPKTGKPTGFPFRADEWNQTIQRINGEKTASAAKRGRTVGEPTVLPSKDVAPPEGIGQPVEGAPSAPSAPAAPTAPAAK